LREIFLEQIEHAGREFGSFAKLLPVIVNDELKKKLFTLKSSKAYVMKRLEGLRFGDM
jgi:hypothetical protein